MVQKENIGDFDNNTAHNALLDCDTWSDRYAALAGRLDVAMQAPNVARQKASFKQLREHLHNYPRESYDVSAAYLPRPSDAFSLADMRHLRSLMDNQRRDGHHALEVYAGDIHQKRVRTPHLTPSASVSKRLKVSSSTANIARQSHATRRGSVIGSRAQVWHGTAAETSGGLTKSKLMKNRAGRIVSRKASKRARQA